MGPDADADAELPSRAPISSDADAARAVSALAAAGAIPKRFSLITERSSASISHSRTGAPIYDTYSQTRGAGGGARHVRAAAVRRCTSRILLPGIYLGTAPATII